MIFTYKLKYNTKAEGMADLISKGIMTEDFNYTNITHAIVDLGHPVLQLGTEELPATYSEEYLYDIMITEEYDFADNVIEPLTPSHSFAGHEPIIIINPLINDNE